MTQEQKNRWLDRVVAPVLAGLIVGLFAFVGSVKVINYRLDQFEILS